MLVSYQFNVEECMHGWTNGHWSNGHDSSAASGVNDVADAKGLGVKKCHGLMTREFECVCVVRNVHESGQWVVLFLLLWVRIVILLH